jgi:hypothetical protein
MSFDNQRNRGRALKIVDILAHVEKSAKANNATPDEITEILTPAVQMLRALGAISTLTLTASDITAADYDWPVTPVPEATPEEPAEVPDEIPGGAWSGARNPSKIATLRDLAATAQLSELSVVLAVYMGRVDEALASN